MNLFFHNHYIKKATLFLILAIMCFLGAFYMWFSLSTQEAIRNNLAGQVAKLQKDEDQNIAFRAMLDKTKKDRDKMTSYFLSRKDAETFIEAIQDNLEPVVGFDVMISPPASIIPTSVFTIQVRGTYRAVHRYLAMIETMPYNITITQVNLASSGEINATSTKEAVWQVGFTISANSFL